MASKTQADSRRMYSWWWDSHISPKNSKWLQENLTDMDAKVKQMIKLIEEDADSFARRAEMYYKKRPELMKLVEEFYRAYRALAERYDHATGALRQAHRTMAEAFLNQVPYAMADDSPAASATESDLHTPNMTPMRALFDPDELQKDALGNSSSNSHAADSSGAFTEECNYVPDGKGLKLFNNVFRSEEGSAFRSEEGSARKSLNFHHAEDKEQDVQTGNSYDIKARVLPESERVDNAELQILTLKKDLAKLEAEKEAGHLQCQRCLERLSNLESEVSRAKKDSMGFNERASKAEAEVQTLKAALAKLETEREDCLIRYQQCLGKISNLESNISHAQNDSGELSERASKVEKEAQSLKQKLTILETEKDAAFIQYNQCLKKLSDVEKKLLLAEEDVRRSNEHADKAEMEVENLKQALTKLTYDNEASDVQLQQCLEKIASLEREIACAQEEAQRLNSDIDEGVAKLRGAEERCLLLDTLNQAMHSEFETLVQKVAAQSGELTEKQKELGRLWTCIQEERLRFMEAETAFQALQHLHSQSQEELRSTAAELQKRVQILEDLETQNKRLQNDVEQTKVLNKGLSEVNLSAALTIQNLRNEISSSRETIEKLEAEVELRADQRNALQQEIYCLNKELNDLRVNHSAIVEQVESVGFNPGCLGSSVKDLQDENMKLKRVSERERSEKLILLEKLEKLIEKNTLLENSLSYLNVELEGVREKVKTLEESCQSHLAEKSNLVSEKAILVSQLQIATRDVERLTEKNKLLENSLLDANAEIEGFMVKEKNLEEKCLLLENEKLDLVSARGSLILQLDIIQTKLEDVEKNHTKLEGKYSSLEKECKSTRHEMEELWAYLNAKNQELASITQLIESQQASMASQISSLEEEVLCGKKEHEEELNKSLNSQIEIFILQNFARDLEEKYCSLLVECQKLLEASKQSEELISKLEHDNLEKQGELKSLFSQIEILRTGLYHVLKRLELDVSHSCEDESQQDKILLNHVVNKLQETQDSLSKVQEENQQLGIQNYVFLTQLGQQQLEVENLLMTKTHVDHELRTISEHLQISQSEIHKLAEMNDELRLKIMEGNHKEEVLKVEVKNLHGEVLDLQQANQNLLEENCKVHDENRSLVKSVADLREEKCNLEGESCSMFIETLSQGTLSLIFRDIISEKCAKIHEQSENLDKLGLFNNDLMEKVKLTEEKLDRLNVMEVERMELHGMMADLKCKYDEAEMVRAEHEIQIFKLSEDCHQLSKEVNCMHEANQKLVNELCRLHGDLLEIKKTEESLNLEIQNGRNEIKLWESYAAAAFVELQMSNVREALLEGRIHELIEACESLNCKNCSSAMEIDQLTEIVSTLEGENGELKAQMSTCIPTFVSLRDCLTSLEHHTSHATLHKVESKGKKDDASAEHSETYPQSEMVSDGFLDLQELLVRIRAIEKAVMENERLVILEYLSANSKLEAAMREIEELKSRSGLKRKSVEVGKDIYPKPEDEKFGDGFRLQKWAHEITEEGHEVMTKDIMLDRASKCSSNGIRRKETVEADDQILEIWKTTDHDGGIDLTVGKTQKVRTATSYKKHNREHFSTDSLVKKKLSVDGLEISRRFSGSSQERNGRKFLERLDSDVQKLTNLHITVQDLKKKVEITQKSKKSRGIEYDIVKEQLEESEEAIMKLFDANRKLMKNIGDESLSLDEKSELALALDEGRTVKRRKIAEQARRVSEKIGRLQLEVQKLQFLLLKLDGESKSKGKTKIVERKTRVVLRDYLYDGGARSKEKRKKGHMCACVQPPTKGD